MLRRTMLKRTMATLMVFAMMLMCIVPVSAETEYTISATAETTITAKLFSSIAGDTSITGDGGIRMKVDGTAIYNLNIEKAGAYRLSIYGGGEGADCPITVTAGETEFSRTVANGMSHKHLGVYTIPSGKQTLTVRATGLAKMYYLYLMPIEYTVAAEGTTRVPTKYFTATNTKLNLVDAHASYEAPDFATSGIKGMLYFGGNGFYGDYSLNVVQTGIYGISLVAAKLDARNVFEIRDANGAVLSQGTVDAANNRVDFSGINLKQGKQTLRIFLRTGAYFSSSDHNEPYLYYFDIAKTGDVEAIAVSGTEETTIPATNYSGATGEIGAVEGCTLIPVGASASFDVNVATAGNYRISAYGSGHEGVSAVDVSIGGITKSKTGIAKRVAGVVGDGHLHMGIYALEAGRQTLTFTAKDAAFRFLYVFFMPVDHAVPASGTTLIKAKDFYATNVAANLIDAHTSYPAPDNSGVKGALYLDGTSKYGDFRLNVASGGNYSIELIGQTFKHDKNQVEVRDENGMVLATGVVDIANNKVTFTDVPLKTGLQTIRFINPKAYIDANTHNEVYYYYFNITRTGDMVQNISENAETALVLSSYPEGTGSITFANGVMTMGAEASVTYNVSAAKAGTYKMIMRGLTAPVSVTVNGDTENTKTLTAGTYRTVGRFNLAEGTNTITVTAPAEAAFSAIRLKSVDNGIAAEGTTLVECEDYISIGISESTFVDNQYNYSLGENVGAVGFSGNNQKATYSLVAEEAGTYDMVVYTTSGKEKNKLALLDAEQNVIAEAGIDTATGTFTLKNVRLEEGKNELTIFTKGLYTSADEWNYLFVYYFELTPKAADLGTYYKAADYTSATDGVTAEGDYIIIPADGVVTYTIDAEAGTYKVLLDASGKDGCADVEVGGQLVEADYFEAERVYRTGGRFDLEEGENTLTITIYDVNAKLYGIIVKNITAEVSATEVTKIEAEDYYSVNFDETMYVDPHTEDEAFDNTGAIEYSTDVVGGTAEAVYKMNAEKNGLYDITLYATGFAESNSFAAVVNGVTYAGTISDNKCVFENVALAAGVSVVKITASGLAEDFDTRNTVKAYYMETEYAGDIATEPVYELYNGATKIDKLESGNITVNVALNGKHEGKEVFFAFAVYKDGRLYKVVSDTVTATKETTFNKTIENLDVTDGVYTAKIFVWQNWCGDCIPYAE